MERNTEGEVFVDIRFEYFYFIGKTSDYRVFDEFCCKAVYDPLANRPQKNLP